jgi:hypothetical protein
LCSQATCYLEPQATCATGDQGDSALQREHAH